VLAASLANRSLQAFFQSFGARRFPGILGRMGVLAVAGLDSQMNRFRAALATVPETGVLRRPSSSCRTSIGMRFAFEGVGTLARYWIRRRQKLQEWL
jgi:hypothetical protein